MKKHRCMLTVAVAAALFQSFAARTEAAVSCNLFCAEPTARFRGEACELEAVVLLASFSNCGEASPGQLLVCVYENLPSDLGGNLFDCWRSACELRPGNAQVRVTFDVSSSSAQNFFVEAWVKPLGFQQASRCTDLDPVRVVAAPAEDLDGDGITCADNCPSVANPLQVDVDKDGQGDVCDPTRGDLDGDGEVDDTDLSVLLSCIAGSGILMPPAGCSGASFGRADLDRDFGVDYADLSAFQVFFGQ